MYANSVFSSFHNDETANSLLSENLPNAFSTSLTQPLTTSYIHSSFDDRSTLSAYAQPTQAVNSSSSFVTNNAGVVGNQADAAMRADIARRFYGVDGTGVTIGVLSDSFNNLGGALRDIATDELPRNTFVLEDLAGGGSDEGRAMMQLIHDIAPGANLIFQQAGANTTEFANNILALANAGANIIVDDIGYLDEPMFQDGVSAQVIDYVVSKGISYFSSAGNSASNSYQSAFNRSNYTYNGGTVYDFDPGLGVDPFQSISIPVGGAINLSFQWDQPFASVSPRSGGSRSDLDIFLFDRSGTRLLASGTTDNIGGDPIEFLQFANNGSFGTDFNLVITLDRGSAPNLLKYVDFGSSSINEYNTFSSTVFGHANAKGAKAVGAAPFYLTPAFGNAPVLENFSSRGGTPILFNSSGTRLSTPEIRLKPSIMAPDNTNTSFFGQDIPQDVDRYPNFAGTSAAAPNAAAVAALMLQANPSARPAAIYAAMDSSALDMDDPLTPGFDRGFDFASGFGLLQADRAIALLVNSKGATAIAQSLNAIEWNSATTDFSYDTKDDLMTRITWASGLDLEFLVSECDAVSEDQMIYQIQAA